MTVAVYALTRDDGRRLGRRGVSGERLRLVRLGTIAAVVGDVARPPSPTEPKLRAYMSLIASLAARYPAILPVRFGTVVSDETELQTIVAARHKTIRTQLAQVRGRVQMTIRVIVGQTVSGSGPPREPEKRRAARGTRTGTQYLSSRAHEQRASSIPNFAPLARAVARWVRDERVERRADVTTVYHLIPTAAAGRYAAAIDAAAAAAGLRVMVSGPWPAHAFADGW